MYKNVADLLKNWGPFFIIKSRCEKAKHFSIFESLTKYGVFRATESTTSYRMCNGLSANWSNYICNKRAVTTVLRVTLHYCNLLSCQNMWI